MGGYQLFNYQLLVKMFVSYCKKSTGKERVDNAGQVNMFNVVISGKR